MSVPFAELASCGQGCGAHGIIVIEPGGPHPGKILIQCSICNNATAILEPDAAKARWNEMQSEIRRRKNE